MDSPSTKPFWPLGIAYFAVASIFALAFIGSGGCGALACSPLVAWYPAHATILRAGSFVAAGLSLALGARLQLRDEQDASRRWRAVLAGVFLAAAATSAATYQQYGDMVEAFQKLAQLAATLVGLYVVAVAGPRELTRWRRTKYDERAAQSAAEAIVAAEDLLGAFGTISSLAHMKGDISKEAGEQYAAYINRWFTERWRGIEPQIEAFRKARVQAQIYLSASACDPLLEIENHTIAIQHAFIDWSVFMDAPMSVRGTAESGYRTLFTELPKIRPNLLLSVKSMLGPVARFSMPPEGPGLP